VSAVVDASVAAQWVLQQELSKRADALRGEDGLIAPSLIAAELGNAIWKAVRWGNVSRAEAGAALNAALLPFDSLVGEETLCVRALAFSIEFAHPIYDCFYLALAERENVPLVTFDETMIAAARKAKIKVRRI
jgi:predicted nucleic acid-binding protein